MSTLYRTIVGDRLNVTGGMVTTFERGGVDYTQVLWRTSGGFTVAGGGIADAQWALGAGGGSTLPGFNKGGGGAGEVRQAGPFHLAAGEYSLAIGAGGVSSPGSNSQILLNGSLALECMGGGIGGSATNAGGDGGNGGGAGGNTGGPRLGGVGEQHNGGASGGADRTPGGGGGAGGDGEDGIIPTTGGDGGPGITLAWTNPPLDVGGGGGGGGNAGTTGSASHGGTAGTDATTPDDADWSGGAGGSRVNIGPGIAKGGDGFFVLMFPTANATVRDRVQGGAAGLLEQSGTSSIHRTIDGDMLDAICKARLGSEAHVPAVLDANPGLAALGPVYPAGVLITLPEVAEPVSTGQIRLWGRT